MQMAPKGKNLRTALFSGYAHFLVDLLAIPILPNNTQLNKHTCQSCATVRFVGAPSAKEQSRCNLPAQPSYYNPSYTKLSYEIHVLIFDQLDLEAALCLALTSQYFWDIGRTQIMRKNASFLGCWAGSPIINLGKWIEAGDIPEGLKAEGWEEILQRRLSLDDLGPDRLAPLSLLNYAETNFKCVDVPPKPPSLDGMIDRLKREHKLPTHLYPGLIDIIRPNLIDYYPSDRVWILRNLTTGEFVRPEGFTIHPQYARGPYIGGVGFGEVVLLRCSWSSSSRGTGLPYPHSLHRGIWAGHRLDITTLDRLTERCSRQASQWKDISEEVAAEVDEIWSMQFPGGWKSAIEFVLMDEGRDWTSLPKSRNLELDLFRDKGILIYSPHGPDYGSQPSEGDSRPGHMGMGIGMFSAG